MYKSILFALFLVATATASSTTDVSAALNCYSAVSTSMHDAEPRCHPLGYHSPWFLFFSTSFSSVALFSLSVSLFSSLPVSCSLPFLLASLSLSLHLLLPLHLSHSLCSPSISLSSSFLSLTPLSLTYVPSLSQRLERRATSTTPLQTALFPTRIMAATTAVDLPG